MRQLILIVILFLIATTAGAISKGDVKAIIESAYPGAKITEIENEHFKGKEVYEVDFKHGGQSLEAIVSLKGELIMVEIDD